MRRSGLNKLRRGEEKLPTSVRAELEELLLNPSPRALRWMIYLSWRERKKEVTDFINAVISSNVSWEGELDPTDKNSFSWASTYASVEKAEDALPTFKTLLPILPEERVDPEPEKRETKEEIEEEEPVTDDVIELLALGINEGESTITDLYEEYKHRPDVIARVEKLLLRSQ